MYTNTYVHAAYLSIPILEFEIDDKMLCNCLKSFSFSSGFIGHKISNNLPHDLTFT